jgi:hypothetical protein
MADSYPNRACLKSNSLQAARPGAGGKKSLAISTLLVIH